MTKPPRTPLDRHRSSYGIALRFAPDGPGGERSDHPGGLRHLLLCRLGGTLRPGGVTLAPAHVVESRAPGKQALPLVHRGEPAVLTGASEARDLEEPVAVLRPPDALK